MLPGKFVVLGVTGSIAAHRAVDLASKLTQEGALVDVILTEAAQQFITSLSFRSLTHRPVVTDMFDPESELSVEHVRLAQRADVVVVAPASAHLIARLALGLADDMLTTTVLATRAPVVIAPAMNVNMWQNQVSQEHVARLRDRGFTFVGPAHGRLATGLVGMGRLAEVEEILDTIRLIMGRSGDLSGQQVVVTAGGTQEPVDAVRVLTNRSSGKMGYALAAAARDRGARVTLISAPTYLRPPVGVTLARVRTAAEMREAVMSALPGASALLMAAAVADYRPAQPISEKIKKEATDRLSLPLERTADILAEVPDTLVKVGFAAELGANLLERAREKLQRKRLDLIVANDISAPDSGFEVDTNRVVLIDGRGRDEELPLMSKYQVAHKVLDRVVAVLKQQQP
ncbi:MAG: bifunctional phosphopantothenoylcysteine decarboxylase/phosphopantothenate--cysteine ligase CoaBC [Chloroflexi bacterium]|nr:bifunctional phosphopantothenoylcysteine decarboxylase/phosphopantothenate--cysteine ligase CoaBC [Chloroflexota bacterium]